MNRKKLITCMIVLVLMATSVLMTGCMAPQAIKIEDQSEAPVEIWEALNSIDLEPGLYYFSGEFLSDGHLYFAVCGDEEFKNNYDVEITSLEHLDGNVDNGKVLDGKFLIDLEELSSASVPDYSTDLKYPFILFKLKMQTAYDDLLISQQDQEMAFNYWWGSDKTAGTAVEFAYEVVQSKEEIPANIWSEIELLNLDRGMYHFEQRDYGADAYYGLICGGEEYKDGYQISFERYNEAAVLSSSDVVGDIMFTVREYGNKGKMAYAEGFKYPFVVIKVQGRRNNQPHTLRGGVSRGVTAFNDRFESSLIVSNWDMRP